jgi:hypothetical protein
MSKAHSNSLEKISFDFIGFSTTKLFYIQQLLHSLILNIRKPPFIPTHKGAFECYQVHGKRHGSCLRSQCDKQNKQTT